MNVFHRRMKYPLITLLYLLAALLVSFSGFNCGGKDDLPDQWESHTFKLAEHPEVFAGEAEAYERLVGYTTLGVESRKGFMIGDHRNISFDVFLPPGGSVKFSYGFGQVLSKFSSEAVLTVKVESDDIETELETLVINTTQEDLIDHWTEVSIPIHPDVGGYKRLVFSLSGIQGNVPARAFFLANPAVVKPGMGKERKRVFLISIDTLRADHLTSYGYERKTSPNIETFANEAVIFERCVSVCPWTFPAYASMYTGRYPSITGATTNVRYLHEDETTLAEIISGIDMPTFYIHNTPWVGREFGLSSGFDIVFDLRNEYADVSFDHARKWLKSHADEDIFVVIHLYDTHLPFKPRDEHYGVFVDETYDGPFKREVLSADAVLGTGREYPDEVKEHVAALYDECLYGCDRDVGAFFDFLKQEELYEDSLIIINSDHGEEFWDHGGFAHGHQLYDELLHVPMIVRGPGFEKGSRIAGMCSNMDTFPTILEWLDLTVPSNVNALSLFDLMEGEVQPDTRKLLSEQLYHGVEQKGVSTDRYRYIFHTLDSSEELYDLTDDTGMKSDVSLDRKATVRDFRYFVTEYTLNEETGWHVFFLRTNRKEGGEHYEGKISAKSGFTDVKRSKLQDDDKLELIGNELHFSVSLAPWVNKAFDFKTNDETDMLNFEITNDAKEGEGQFVFLGPESVPMEETAFALSILDPMFGLGNPQFGPQGGKIHGMYIWGNSESLREETSPDVSDQTREELKSLGYLN
jgi:arylsulfatase A-like enzyme